MLEPLKCFTILNAMTFHHTLCRNLLANNELYHQLVEFFDRISVFDELLVGSWTFFIYFCSEIIPLLLIFCETIVCLHHFTLQVLLWRLFNNFIDWVALFKCVILSLTGF